MSRPKEVYTIRLQPKTGLYALRDGKAVLLGTFATYAEAEAEALLLFPEKPRFKRRSTA